MTTPTRRSARSSKGATNDSSTDDLPVASDIKTVSAQDSSMPTPPETSEAEKKPRRRAPRKSPAKKSVPQSPATPETVATIDTIAAPTVVQDTPKRKRASKSRKTVTTSDNVLPEIETPDHSDKRNDENSQLKPLQALIELASDFVQPVLPGLIPPPEANEKAGKQEKVAPAGESNHSSENELNVQSTEQKKAGKSRRRRSSRKKNKETMIPDADPDSPELQQPDPEPVLSQTHPEPVESTDTPQEEVNRHSQFNNDRQGNSNRKKNHHQFAVHAAGKEAPAPSRTDILLADTINLLAKASEILASPELTSSVIDSILYTDETTGVKSLRFNIPISDRETVVEALNLFAKLLHCR